MTEIENGLRVAESSLPPRLSDQQIDAIETDAREMADETRAKGGFNYLASTTFDLVAEVRAGRERETALRQQMDTLQADGADLATALQALLHANDAIADEWTEEIMECQTAGWALLDRYAND